MEGDSQTQPPISPITTAIPPIQLSTLIQTTENTQTTVRACCKARIASCLSCAAGMEIEEYCKQNPDTVGCKGEIGCQDDSECPMKEACFNFECTNACSRIRCPPHDFCQVNNHIPKCKPNLECRSDFQCKNGWICVRNKCTPPKPVLKINGTQCSKGELTWCPSDTCNLGFCKNGCASESCATWKGCPGKFIEFAVQEKYENQLCIIRTNNCKSGLKCVDQEDGCDNGIGRCIKSGYKPRQGGHGGSYNNGYDGTYNNGQGGSYNDGKQEERYNPWQEYY